MAYSASEAAYNGSSGGHYRIVAATDILAQEEDNNRTLVRFYGYMRKSGSSQVWNLDPTYCNIQPDGVLINGNVNGYDGRYGSGPWYGITYDAWIGHDGNGNRGVQAYTYHNASNSPYLTDAATAHTAYLPYLYQEIGYNDIQIINVTDVSFQVYVAVNRTANLLQLSIDGGGFQTYYGSNYGSVTVQVGSQANPITSGINHTVQLRVRRASNNHIADSGVYNVATLGQNNFFDIGDF